MPDIPVSRRISGAIMRIRSQAPFFGVLALHAEFKESDRIPTAATDGRTIYYNPEFFAKLSNEEVAGVMLHEVLHCAFLHIPRERGRDHERWNYAADYAINPMVIENPRFKLPKGALLDDQYAGRRVEEIYDMLPEPQVIQVQFPNAWNDLRPDLRPNDNGNGNGQQDQNGQQKPQDGSSSGGGATKQARLFDAPGGAGDDQQGQEDGDQNGQGGGQDNQHQGQDAAQASNGGSSRDPASDERYWRNAVNKAAQVHIMSGKGRGTLPAGVDVLLDEVNVPEVDWKTLLWEYTVGHPSNYEGFDRRFIHDGLYLDQLEGEKLHIEVAVDTSGSCLDWVTPFMGELKGILSAFPHVEAHVSYVDAALVGPYEVSDFDDVPTPKGGGGTSFKPPFEYLDENADPFGHYALVYLTDGYGDFPNDEPPFDTIWVVTPGGLESESFPFGKVIRLQGDPHHQ